MDHKLKGIIHELSNRKIKIVFLRSIIRVKCREKNASEKSPAHR